MTVSTLPILVALAAALAFVVRRTLTYLHIFQQEEYDGPRFVRWMLRTRSFDRRLSAALLAIGLAELALGELVSWPFPLIAAVSFGIVAWREPNPLTASKKKLVLTARARRILGGALVLACGATLAGAVSGLTAAWILVVQFLPFALVLANGALIPVERAIQNRYWHEAHDKLHRLAPKVIGVTGSFGKTSVKHILGHILEMTAPTLITPGSINTPMGIARIVRERLDARHRFFVVEMGAYGPGSIERLCRLAPPDMGIVTAIGLAHYERFKSLDTVARTKFELADAVAARSGTLVAATPTLDFPATRAFADRHPDTIVRCGESGADLTITASRQEITGTVVEVTWQGRPYVLRAPIHGAHHGTNIALAFAGACVLGIDPELAVTALKSTPQVPHRLEVKPQADGSILIDDAYNSNPIGFAGALDLLALLRRDGGRRILVTPGMVELGAAHDTEHERLGTHAAACVDILLPVRPERIATFVAAFRACSPAATVLPCASFAEAEAWLRANVGAGDAVLLENDLPDIYERKLSL